MKVKSHKRRVSGRTIKVKSHSRHGSHRKHHLKHRHEGHKGRRHSYHSKMMIHHSMDI